MTQQILINASPQETRVAVVEHGSVQELQMERSLDRSIVGNIYAGKVIRILPSMQAAFVDIGLSRNAFLHIGDIWPLEGQPIERVLHEGQVIRVQIIKDEIGGKGARLATRISLTGRLLVLLPQEQGIMVSQRLHNDIAKQQLKADLTALVLPTALAGMGFIVRTKASQAALAEFERDIAYLEKTFSAIANSALDKPRLIWRELDLAKRSLRDFVNPDVSVIQIDADAAFEELHGFASSYMPELLPRLYHHKDQRPIFDLFGIEDEINRALGQRIDLKSGGYIVFDQTEAMTVIDVNTGGFVNGRNLEDMVYKTNLEAAHSIARQLRLRNIGGIVVIDFIDMRSADHRANVITELRLLLAKDVVKTSVSEFSQLGLVEVTRRRTRESLSQFLCSTCPTCQGRGEVKSVRTVCYEILREVTREALQFKPQGFRLIASNDVIEAFLEAESPFFAALTEQVGKDISLHTDAGFSPQQYEIVLL